MKQLSSKKKEARKTRGSRTAASIALPDPSPIRVLIAASDPDLRFAVRSLIESENEMDVVGEAASADETLDAVRRLGPDLMVLDVELGNADGLGLVRHFGAERVPAVVFVAGDDRSAAEAFRLNAFDYIVKPFSDDRLRWALDRARQCLREDQLGLLLGRLSALIAEVRGVRNYPHRLLTRSRGHMRILNVDDIDWIEADARYSRVHMCDGAVQRLREPISRIEERLDPSQFARVHRSAIVNLDRVVDVVSSAGSQTVLLKDGTRLPMGRSQRLHVSALSEEG